MSAILVVDDLEQNRYLLRAILTASAYEVLEAAHGAEALELARRAHPALIISDILMPQMDGFALCRECKRDEALRDIPFVFYTATYTDPRDEALAMQLGAARFIIKPVESEEFIAIVREVLEERAAGKLTTLPSLPEEETVFYRLYNETLVRKLEDKMLDLERLNHKLAESEARFESMIRNAADMIVSLDAEGSIRYASPACKRILGYEPQEVIDRNFLEWVHPDDLPEAQAAFASRRQTPGAAPASVEVRGRHKDGSWRALEAVGTNLLGDAAVQALVLNVRDVTERVWAEGALRESEARYQLISMVASDYMFSTHLKADEQLHLDWVAGAFESITGYTLEEYTARGGWRAAVHPDDLAVDDRDMETLCANQRVVTEIRTLTKSGQIRWVRVYAHPTLDEQSRELVSIYGAVQDITERKQAEEALQLSEEKYRTLVDEVNDGFYMTDHAGGFTFANPALARMHGFESPGALAGRKFTDLVKPEMQADLGEAYGTAMQTGRAPELINGQITRPDGTRVFIEIKPTFIVKGGQIAGSRGVVRDITERKQRERELMAMAAVSAALRVARTRVEMLPVILDQLLSLLEMDGAALMMLDPASGELHAELCRGVWATFTGTRTSPGAGLSGQVLATGQPYLSNDIRSDPRLLRPDAFSECPCAAAAPLATHGQIIGLLWIGRARPLTDRDLRLLIAIADMAANAIHRAALHEETARRVEQLQALQTIDRAITASLDMRLSLNVVLEQTIAQLRAAAAGVLLYNPHAHSLNYVVGRGFRARNYEQSHLRLGEGQAGNAALEWRVICVTDIARCDPPFARLPLLTGEGFVSYAAVPLISKGQLKGVLEIFHRAPFQPDDEWLNFLEALAQQAAIAVDNAQLFDNLQQSNLELSLAYDTTIEGWSRALDLRDKETEGHTQRVTEMTLRLAHAAGMTEAELVHVKRGALLHDIGKMGVPDSILLKPGKLTEDEWVIMRKHPVYAYDLLSPIAYLRPALDIPYCHHEKWDGSGYPRGLKSEEIPLAARLFAVMDVWDALRSDRPYRAGWPEEKVLEHIKAGSGTHFDPKAVGLFLKVMIEDT